MPLIHYAHGKDECPYSISKFFRSPKDAPSTVKCIKCTKDMKKMLKGPSSSSIISIDNGFQARATEVNLEIVEDIETRSTKDFKDK